MLALLQQNTQIICKACGESSKLISFVSHFQDGFDDGSKEEPAVKTFAQIMYGTLVTLLNTNFH